MKKVLYIMSSGNSKMVVSNKPFPNAESTIEQHEADITSWAEILKGEMIACYDIQGAANQHASLLCWHISQGADMQTLSAIALATSRLMEYAGEKEYAETPEEPHAMH